MIALDCKDKQFQSILRKELPLGKEAVFGTRVILEGTQIYEHCICTISDGDITFVLIRGSFVATDVYVLMKTDLPEDFQFPMIARELKGKGFDPTRVRLVCIAVNEPGRVPGAQKLPDIQIFRIPF